MSHHDFVAKWAAGEILTSTSPADRRALQKVLEDYRDISEKWCNVARSHIVLSEKFAALQKENEELKVASNHNAYLLDQCREARDRYAAQCFANRKQE